MVEQIVKVSSRPDELRKRASQIEKIIKMYNDGINEQSIAEYFGVSRPMIHFILVANQVK